MSSLAKQRARRACAAPVFVGATSELQHFDITGNQQPILLVGKAGLVVGIADNIAEPPLSRLPRGFGRMHALPTAPASRKAHVRAAESGKAAHKPANDATDPAINSMCGAARWQQVGESAAFTHKKNLPLTRLVLPHPPQESEDGACAH